MKTLLASTNHPFFQSLMTLFFIAIVLSLPFASPADAEVYKTLVSGYLKSFAANRTGI